MVLSKEFLEQFFAAGERGEKLGILATNQEEADAICSSFREMGKHWNSGASYMQTMYGYAEGGCMIYSNQGTYRASDEANYELFTFDQVADIGNVDEIGWDAMFAEGS